MLILKRKREIEVISFKVKRERSPKNHSPKRRQCIVMSDSRLFRILYHLLDKGRATAPELAAKFEVSQRTIYRDIDALSSAGIPVKKPVFPKICLVFQAPSGLFLDF